MGEGMSAMFSISRSEKFTWAKRLPTTLEVAHTCTLRRCCPCQLEASQTRHANISMVV